MQVFILTRITTTVKLIYGIKTSPVTDEFPAAHRASNVENVSIW